MSKTTKKKHVTREVLNDFNLPEDKEEIVKVIASRGNNLHEVLTSNGDKYLVSMPSKYRKSIWIKRGDYLIVSPIEEGDKVRAEITSILLKNQIRYIREEGKWPSAFDETNSESNSESNNDSNNDSNSDQLFRNTNRALCEESCDSSGSDTDSHEGQAHDSDAEQITI